MPNPPSNLARRAFTPSDTRAAGPRSGFTLVEMLAVIGVLTVLVGIIVLAYSAVGDNMSSRRTRVAFEAGRALQAEYELTAQLPSGLKNAGVDARSPHLLTYAAMFEFRRVAKAREMLEKSSDQQLSNVPLPTWDSTANYVVGDLVERLGTNYRATQANTNSTPGGSNTNWVVVSAVSGLKDGWGTALAFVGTGGFSNTVGNGTTQTIKSPDGRPFWVSAGPDRDFETHDDNLYSFEN